MDRKTIAMDNFLKGYNCAQSVVLAYAKDLNLDENMLSQLACSFGGGMGRLREVCGAVSGSFMVLGLLYGYSGPEKGALKKEQYQRVQDLAHKFEEINGSIVCRDLLNLSLKHDAPTPEERTEAYYKKRPCKEIIGCAVELLENFISEHQTDLKIDFIKK
ncbi:MAG: C-GCAxxG-C-C family protein [Succinivibrio sp.]